MLAATNTTAPPNVSVDSLDVEVMFLSNSVELVRCVVLITIDRRATFAVSWLANVQFTAKIVVFLTVPATEMANSAIIGPEGSNDVVVVAVVVVESGVAAVAVVAGTAVVVLIVCPNEVDTVVVVLVVLVVAVLVELGVVATPEVVEGALFRHSESCRKIVESSTAAPVWARQRLP